MATEPLLSENLKLILKKAVRWTFSSQKYIFSLLVYKDLLH